MITAVLQRVQAVQVVLQEVRSLNIYRFPFRSQFVYQIVQIVDSPFLFLLDRVIFLLLKVWLLYVLLTATLLLFLTSMELLYISTWYYSHSLMLYFSLIVTATGIRRTLHGRRLYPGDVVTTDAREGRKSGTLLSSHHLRLICLVNLVASYSVYFTL